MHQGPKNPWPKKGVRPVTGMGVAGSVIRIEGGLPENSDNIPVHSSGSAAEASDHIADSSKPEVPIMHRIMGSWPMGWLMVSPSDRKREMILYQLYTIMWIVYGLIPPPSRSKNACSGAFAPNSPETQGYFVPLPGTLLLSRS